ncbi:MAG: uroporphyrinogen-III synthase [Actinomycetales bacterium]
MSRPQHQTLAGCTFAITADRRAGELAAALARRGAVVRHAPSLSIVPHVDDVELLNRTRNLIAYPPDIVVVTTGIGLRGWVEAADAAGVADDLLAVLRRARLVARGPKARGALQACGLQADWVAETETSAEIIDFLRAEGVRELAVAVQHHGAGDDGLHDALAGAGARVRDLVVYRWGPPRDPAAVDASTRWASTGEVDAVIYTSAPGAAAWLASARTNGLLDRIRARAQEGTVLHACVGPITAAPLERVSIPTLIPERSRMGALVRAVIAYYDGAGSVGVPTCAGSLVLRSCGVLLDGDYRPLSPGPLAVLRALVDADGGIVTRADLLRVLPGESTDPHAAEVAVARLREGIGVPGVVGTVVKRGYRLVGATDGNRTVSVM